MKLSELSTRRVVCASPEDAVSQAIAIMEEHSIHHLPVQSAGEVVGMVSDRDLLMVDTGQDRSGGKKPGKKPVDESRVGDVMSQPVLTLSPDDALRSATWMMITNRIHAIPLIRGKKLVGLVTESDVLHGMISSHAHLRPNEQELLQQPISKYLSGKLVTVAPTATLDDVVDVMCKKQIRHVPVVNNDDLLGIISDRDVRRAFGNASVLDARAQESGKYFLGPSEVHEVMTTDVRTVAPHTTTKTAIEELLHHKIHCLPVVDDEILIGLITDTDLLRAIGAADKEGSRE